MKPDEIRKFRFVYQNSGHCPWPSDVKLIRISGDQLESEINANQNEVKPNVHWSRMILLNQIWLIFMLIKHQFYLKGLLTQKIRW